MEKFGTSPSKAGSVFRRLFYLENVEMLKNI